MFRIICTICLKQKQSTLCLNRTVGYLTRPGQRPGEARPGPRPGEFCFALICFALRCFQPQPQNIYVYIHIYGHISDGARIDLGGTWRKRGVRTWTKERTSGDVHPNSWVHCNHEATPFRAFQAKFGEHRCDTRVLVLLHGFGCLSQRPKTWICVCVHIYIYLYTCMCIHVHHHTFCLFKQALAWIWPAVERSTRCFGLLVS